MCVGVEVACIWKCGWSLNVLDFSTMDVFAPWCSLLIWDISTVRWSSLLWNIYPHVERQFRIPQESTVSQYTGSIDQHWNSRGGQTRSRVFLSTSKNYFLNIQRITDSTQSTASYRTDKKCLVLRWCIFCCCANKITLVGMIQISPKIHKHTLMHTFCLKRCSEIEEKLMRSCFQSASLCVDVSPEPDGSKMQQKLTFSLLKSCSEWWEFYTLINKDNKRRIKTSSFPAKW